MSWDRLPSLSTGGDGIPVLRPTLAEFKNFNKYVKKLEQTKAAIIGIVKVWIDFFVQYMLCLDLMLMKTWMSFYWEHS